MKQCRMVFSNIFLPFRAMVIVKNGFKSRNNRLVAGNTVKRIVKLIIRGEERMKLPRPREREVGEVCLRVSQFIEGVTIVGFHPDDVNGSGARGEDGM